MLYQALPILNLNALYSPLQWHSLNRDEQAKYYDLARKERQLHMQMYPGWSARDNYAQNKKKKRKKIQEMKSSSGTVLPTTSPMMGQQQQHQQQQQQEDLQRPGMFIGRSL